MAFLAPIGAAIASVFGTTGIAATTAAVVGTAGALTTGASLLTKAAGPAKLVPAPVTTPSPAASLVDAQAAAEARRKTSLLSGGITNKTGSTGALLGPEQVKRKTLLGE